MTDPNDAPKKPTPVPAGKPYLEAHNRERGLPEQTRDHPAWPAFKAWADEHLGDVLRGAYWDCWLAVLKSREVKS